jgi:hypothetical protein
MNIRNLENYSYKQWESGLVTPITDETLGRWQYRLSVRKKWVRSTFFSGFRQWQRGKVTPLNNQVLKKWELYQFKLSILKYYGLSKKKYTIHGLFPNQHFLNDPSDIDVIPITHFTHEILHSTYTKQELLIDPVGLVITVLEDSFKRANQTKPKNLKNAVNKKHSKEIRNFQQYQYFLWNLGKITPISDEILENWMHNRSRDKFYSTYNKYKQGKVTPIKDSHKHTFDYLIIREKTLTANNIGKNSKKYTIHHLLPKHLFPDRFTDPDNCILLASTIHEIIHNRYSIPELVIDPIMPVIKSLETSFIESK